MRLITTTFYSCRFRLDHCWLRATRVGELRLEVERRLWNSLIIYVYNFQEFE